jgi:hypothetical protein
MSIAITDGLNEEEYQAERAKRKKLSGKLGLAPEEWRCVHIKRNGQRCRAWRFKDCTRCRVHGGALQKRARRASSSKTRVDTLPRFYKKNMCKTLTAYVAECLESPPSEQLSVFEELALLRHYAEQHVALYSIAVSLPDDNAKKMDCVMSAGELMKCQLQAVVDMTARAVSMENSAADKISVHHLAFVINQIVRISHEVLGEHQELAENFERLVRERIQLPTSGATGTSITPDMIDGEVVEMDETIPDAPDVCEEELVTV